MTHEMLQAHPATSGDPSTIGQALTALAECAQTCTICADACLAEDMVAELRTCIRLNLDCADVCETTARLLARQVGTDTAVVRAQLQACVAACQACAQECDRHAQMHEHCRICAESCRRCERACTALLGALG